MFNLSNELRLALRRISRAPAPFLIASLLIAICTAAIVQIVSIAQALFFSPLPVRNPANLVQLFVQQPKRPADPFFDYPFLRQLARNSSTLQNVTGQFETTRALEHNGQVQRVHALAVTNNYFSQLGITAALGRMLGPNDTHLAVLSHNLWQSTFQSSPAIVGQTIHLQGKVYIVAGVAPGIFNGTLIDTSPDLWIPYSDLPETSLHPDTSLDRFSTQIIARLRPNLSLAQARSETAGLWTRYMNSTGPSDDQYALTRGTLEVHSISNGVSPLRNQSKLALSLLLGGSALLLLIVCSNLGGLMLSRAVAAEKETAIRLALGATRVRVIQQWLADSVLLTLSGAAIGLLFAYAGMPLLLRSLPPARGIGFDPAEQRALILHPKLDFSVAAFCLLLALITTAITAAAPAWKAARADVNAALKRSSADRQHRFFQALLSAFQIALCAALLISAGLILRSLSNLRNLAPGFDQFHVATFTVDTYVARYSQQQTFALQQRILETAQHVPGVQSVAFADRGLMRGIGLGSSVVFPGDTAGGVINTSVNTVTPGYFDVMGMHLLAGRDFVPSDSEAAQLSSKVVVNQAFVRKFLSGQSPLGIPFATGNRFIKPEYEIIGVVSDSKYRSLREIPPPTYYLCAFGPQAEWSSFIVHIRTKGDPRSALEALPRLIHSTDPQVPIYAAATLSEEIDHSLWQERSVAALTSAFAGFALILSLVGMYGIVSYFAAQHAREIALRMALGANRRHVFALLLSRIAPLSIAGVISGICISSWIAKAARSLLFDVQPLDPTVALSVAAILVTVTIAATVKPLLTALRLDPSTKLRPD